MVTLYRFLGNILAIISIVQIDGQLCKGKRHNNTNRDVDLNLNKKLRSQWIWTRDR